MKSGNFIPNDWQRLIILTEFHLEFYNEMQVWHVIIWFVVEFSIIFQGIRSGGLVSVL